MAGNDLPSLGRVKLSDLAASEGLPSDSFKSAVSTLCQSLAQYSAAVVQFPCKDAALLRLGLESARLYFNQKPPYPLTDMINASESREWCKTSGYYADPQLWQETYDYRPGLTPTESVNEMEIPPVSMVEIFAILGRAARDLLDAISFNLNLRSSPFTEILDNVPLRNREISSSVLSVCCHGRPSFHGAQQHTLANGEDERFAMFSEQEHLTDKSLLTIVKSDKSGLHVRDFQGHWNLVDGDLGPQDMVVYPGLALYQATAAYISPALHRNVISDSQSNMHGRCSLAFKFMPKSMAIFNCSEMRAAGHGVEAQFQLPVPVDDFMQRPHSADQLFNRQTLPSYNFPLTQEGSMKPLMKRKKNSLKWKPLPPSKRLRLEAQRVLKDRVQDIADKKGIKLRFCNLKDCENHIHSIDSPCANIRLEIGWPAGVPFVHPHDLPNKAKIGFLEAYEPGWSITHDMELTLIDPGQSSQHLAHWHDDSLFSCIMQDSSTILKISALLVLLKRMFCLRDSWTLDKQLYNTFCRLSLAYLSREVLGADFVILPTQSCKQGSLLRSSWLDMHSLRLLTCVLRFLKQHGIVDSSSIPANPVQNVKVHHLKDKRTYRCNRCTVYSQKGAKTNERRLKAMPVVSIHL